MKLLSRVSLVLSALAASACGSTTPPASDAAAHDAAVDAPFTDASADAPGDQLAEAAADAVAPEAEAAAPDAGPPDEAALVAARKFGLAVPKGYDAAHPTPLILLLHGYGATGDIQFKYFGFDTLADSRTVFVAYPDGLVDTKGSQYWEGTDACCDLDHTHVDDVAYLTAVVHDVQKRYAIDPKRIFVVGHSNGGFMAHRLGCERADLFAAVFSLAGAQFIDASKCRPSRPVSVAELHGDKDETIKYLGGTVKDHLGGGVDYPSASQTVATWAKLDGCADPIASTGKTLDLDSTLAGAETSVTAFGKCGGLSGVELWTIAGGTHIPSLTSGFGDAVLDFLLAHPMP